ncbi:MAG: radical SAM protein [Desulfobacterales bacterium]|nr:MAG: radical SAM protein [Desulfobacterales bacterium]
MGSRNSGKKQDNLIAALVANPAGEIFELEGYAAVGMAGGTQVPLTTRETRPMPFGGELMFLPERRPILLNLATGRLETLEVNPYAPGEALFPVAAFNSPGYVIAYVTAYREKKRAGQLPLFAYGAVGWHRGKFRTAVIQVDPERRQDLRLMPPEDVAAGMARMRRRMPSNRLRAHLEKCAREYGCPAGKNFFLGRYEAPLPTSPECNARCLGCLSLQTGGQIPRSQERIGFKPSEEEIAEVALAHIRRVPQSVVSFGQGCEGDPLLAADVIEPAIRRIRARTRAGTINMNTNGSRPAILQRLLDAGLDSVRISINSVRQDCYDAYFRPKAYGFADVCHSIDRTLQSGKFVSINYLNCPGFTDTPQELEALRRFLDRYPINMIQWRNLNFDPIRYWKIMNGIARHSRPQGMKNALRLVRQAFPHLKYGYFNPPKEKFNEVD